MEHNEEKCAQSAQYVPHKQQRIQASLLLGFTADSLKEPLQDAYNLAMPTGYATAAVGAT
jgi:hypothetical protein